MRILYYFQELDTPMFQWQRKHFLDELPRHGIEIDTFNPLLYASVEEANEKLVAAVKKGNYDLFISNMGYYKMLYVDTLQQIKALGIPTMRIAWDNLMIPYIDEVLSPHFDLVWLTAKETERIYKKWGVNYFFAPYAANPYTYHYSLPTVLKRSACFIGNPHGSRTIMINALTTQGVKVDLYCGRRKQQEDGSTKINLSCSILNPSTKETILNRFRFKEGRMLMKGSVVNKMKGKTVLASNEQLVRHEGLPHDEMVSTYASSVLSLASTSAGHTDVLKTPLPIINLRNFEVPMCGGIEICKYNKELADYFADGKEILFYHNDDELVEKARYYTQKATDSEIFAIKETARKRAETEHTWWNRFRAAFDLLGLKYK